MNPVFPSLVEYLRTQTGLISESVNYSGITSYILKHVLSGEEVLFLSLDESSGKMTIENAQGLRSHGLTGKSLTFGGNIRSPIWVKQAVLIISDMDCEQQLINGDELLEELWLIGIKSLMMAAVNERGLIIVGSVAQNVFSKYDENFLKSTAVQAAYIIESSIRVREVKRELKDKEEQLSLTEKIAFTSDLPEMLRSTLKAVHAVVRGDTGSIMLIDETGQALKVKAAFGLPKEAGRYSVRIGEGIAGWVAKNRRGVVIDDLPPGEISLKRERDLVSSISVPMMAKDRLVGVVNVGSKKESARFNQEHIDKVAKLISKASIAIDNTRRGKGFEGAFVETIKAMARLIETKDTTLRGHAERVARYAVKTARKLDRPESEVRSILLAATLHDIGYAGINQAIFRVRSPLSTVERVLVNTHPIIASDALKDIARFNEITDIILHHHERFDGKGYVSGLKGDAIPLGSRIIAIADAFDAMTTRRSYRESLSLEKTIEELKDKSGKQFDPKLVNVFIDSIEIDGKTD